jgi:anti-sigma B factor antagonist
VEVSVKITITNSEDILIVSVSGRLDTVSAVEFQGKMQELLDDAPVRVVLDCENLEYVSSAGLRSILVTAKKAKTLGRTICCCSLQDMVKKVFQVSGFFTLIPVRDCLDDALKG